MINLVLTNHNRYHGLTTLKRIGRVPSPHFWVHDDIYETTDKTGTLRFEAKQGYIESIVDVLNCLDIPYVLSHVYCFND